MDVAMKLWKLHYHWFHHPTIYSSLDVNNLSHHEPIEGSCGCIREETNNIQTTLFSQSMQNGKSPIYASLLFPQSVLSSWRALIRVIHPAHCDPSLSCNVLCFCSLRDNLHIWRHTAVVTWDLSCELDPFLHHCPSLWIWITPNWDTLMMTCVFQSSLFRLIPPERIPSSIDSVRERITNECY